MSNSYNLTPAQRGKQISYKGYKLEISGQYCLIYSGESAVWQVVGEYAEAIQAIDDGDIPGEGS